MPETVKTSVRVLILAAGAWLFAFAAFAQDEDGLNPPDVPMHSAESESLTCSFEGLQVFRQKHDNGPEEVDIVFLLTEKPPAYFNYYDADKKAVVFDFYDTRVGESLIDTLHAPPITTSSVESVRVDLNRDVPGLKPDFRDIVRVSLYTPNDFEYDVREEENVITLSFNRSGVEGPLAGAPGSPSEGSQDTRQLRSGTAFYWQFPLALVAAGGAGFVTYELLKTSSSKPNGLPCCPEHPSP